MNRQTRKILAATMGLACFAGTVAAGEPGISDETAANDFLTSEFKASFRDETVLELSSGQLIGRTVWTSDNKEAGEVDSLVRERATGRGFVVVEAGGLFGLGAKHVVVRLEQVAVTPRGDVRIPLTESQLDDYPGSLKDDFEKFDGQVRDLVY